MASRVVGMPASASAARSNAPVAIGGFKMPEMPSFGGFGGGDDFQLIPSDVQFKDVDGDTVTLRAVSGGKVDFCKNACPNSPPLTSPWLPIFGTVVNGKLRLSKAVLVKNGNSLEITGTVTKGTPLSAIGFNLEDVITEGTTPMDPADCDKAIATAQ